MTTLLLILLTLYVLFMLAPRLLVWWAKRKFNQTVAQGQRQAQQQQQAQHQQRRTHLDEVVSEDAEFVEISATREQTTTQTQDTFTVEEQVVDAEFEDI